MAMVSWGAVTLDAKDEHSDNVAVISSIGNEVYFSGGINTKTIDKLIIEINKVRTELIKTTTKNVIEIILFIDSGGGYLTPTFKFIDFMRLMEINHNTKFHSIIVGHSASAATLIAASCYKRSMTKNAISMIHELSAGNSSNFTRMVSYMDFLTILHKKIINIYVDVSTKSKEEIEELLKKEKWFTPEEYKELGLIQEII